jgi:hypothetical protein
MVVVYPDIVLPREPAYRVKQLRLLAIEYQARKAGSSERMKKYLNFRILVLQDLMTSGIANFEHSIKIWRLSYPTQSLSKAKQEWEVITAYAQNGGITLNTKGKGSLDERFPPDKLK